MNKIRVRYAPSPTGQLHIGGARTALFNYLFAKKHKGDFIVRIEDTDIERNIKDGEASQLDNLAWLGIHPDESPSKPNPEVGKYRQSERLETYRKASQQLLEKGIAYYCYCTSEELEAEREAQIISKQKPRYSGKCAKANHPFKANASIRINVPKDKKFKWQDIVRGEILVYGSEISDWVIIKGNGIPTYNFAAVVDDIAFKISHVLRGEEHIPNTPKQLHLYELFGATPPQFGHIALITNMEGKKLSKRDESIIQFIKQYKDLGYIPEAIFNFLSLLGWSPVGEEEVFSHDQLCEIFDSERLSKSPSKFDTDKLEFFNGVYMKKISAEEYLKLATKFAKTKYSNIDFSTEENKAKLLLFKNEIKTGSEITNKIKIFFNNKFEVSKEAQEFMNSEATHQNVGNAFLSSIKNIDWSIEEITNAINSVKENEGVKGKNLFMPIRITATGQMHGPELKQTILLLGKDKILKNK